MIQLQKETKRSRFKGKKRRQEEKNHGGSNVLIDLGGGEKNDTPQLKGIKIPIKRLRRIVIKKRGGMQTRTDNR